MRNRFPNTLGTSHRASASRARVLAGLAADPERFARSAWLGKALRDMEDRDPVDAVNDAEALLAACTARLDAIMRSVQK